MKNQNFYHLIAQAIRRHFARLSEQSNLRMAVQGGLEWFILSFLISSILNYFWETPSRFENVDTDFLKLAFSAIIIAPFFETILFQWLPIEVTRLMKLKRQCGFWASALAFAVAHYSAGVESFMTAGVIGGSYLAFAYITKRESSAKAAFFQAWLMHFIFNSFLFAVAGISFLFE